MPTPTLTLPVSRGMATKLPLLSVRGAKKGILLYGSSLGQCHNDLPPISDG